MRDTYYISGHRNPDADSIASAYALAELRRAQNPDADYVPVCPGVLPERPAHLFRRFDVTPPQRRNDLYLRMRDLLRPAPAILAGTSLFEAVTILRERRIQQLPVTEESGRYLGMMSALSLLSRLLNIGAEDGAESFAGRRIRSSITLMAGVLEAEMLSAFDSEKISDFDVYVAAMRAESFEEHIPVRENKNLVVIVGNRTEILWKVIDNGVRLLVITGTEDVPGGVVAAAKLRGVSVLRTDLDSATVTRRLKFSMPVELAEMSVAGTLVLSPDDRLRDFRTRILRSPSELFPVVDGNGMLLGVISKKTLSEPPPHRMILVDHNEPEQRIPGAEELPVVEIVDHHRIGTIGTTSPIRFTGDVVGSTCTLVAKMFREAGVPLSAGTAGVLLGGLISDTLVLKSPTTTPLDREICAWLEKLCGVTARELMRELLKINSPLTAKSAADVINGDRKNYTSGRFRFALSQVEESNLQLLHLRREELEKEMRTACSAGGIHFFGLLVTDAVREVSEMLAVGDEEIIRSLHYTRVAEGIFELPGVLSRKKQLLPQVLAVLAELEI
ncbi:MAG: putative manganese-dependent inorganic diphosphatase [Verrucomicrobia bacterium]|nr:putative manganese-dependent inorganic diphosphatase [Verrucomicrobiota bacterium]